jgi:hypothetical protein
MRFRVGVIESAATAVRGRGSLVRHLRMLAEVRRIEEMVVINESQRQSLAWVTVVFEVTCAPKTPPDLCRVRPTKGRTHEGTIYGRTDHSDDQGTGIW